MALREREVTGFVVDGDGTPVANAKVKFKPTGNLGFTATHVIVDREFTADTDENGQFSITLWCDEDSLVPINYNVYFPIADSGLADNQHIANFSLAYDDGEPIQIGTLLAMGIPSPTPQELLYQSIQSLINEHLANNIASDSEFGHVKIDGITITIDENGVISSAGGGGVAVKSGHGTDYYHAMFDNGEIADSSWEETQSGIIRSTGKKVLVRNNVGEYYTVLFELFSQGYGSGTKFEQGESVAIQTGNNDSNYLDFRNYANAVIAARFYTGYTPTVRQIIYTAANGVRGLDIQGTAGQTADYFTARKDTELVARIGPDGEIISANHTELDLTNLADGEFGMFLDTVAERIKFRANIGGVLYGETIVLATI